LAVSREAQPLYTRPAPVSDELLEALETELERVKYQPGDHPIVPVKHDAFVKAITNMLAKHKGPQS
jgi:hypothetical protein